MSKVYNQILKMPFSDYMKIVCGVSLNQDSMGGISPLLKEKPLEGVYTDTLRRLYIPPGHIFGVKTDYPSLSKNHKIFEDQA